MTDGPPSFARQTGSAVTWQTLQLVGVNAVHVMRLAVLAHLLSPDDFGLLAMGIVSVELLLQATDLGMMAALVQRGPATDSNYDAAWTIGVIRGVCLSALLFVMAPLAGIVFQAPRAPEVVRALAIRPILQAAASIRMADLVRTLDFRAIMLLKLCEAVTIAVVSVVLARPLGVWGLIAGTLAGPVVATVMSYGLAPYRPRLTLDRRSVRPLIGFGRWVFLTSIFAAVGNLILQAAISRELGAEQLGLYFMAARLVYLPLEVLGEVVGTVAFPLYARLQSNVEEATAVFRRLLIASSAVGYPSLAVIIAFAPSLDAVLGSAWTGTSGIIRILAVSAVVGLVGDLAVPVYKGFGRPQFVTALELVQSTLVTVLVWPCVTHYGVVGAAVAWLPAALASQLLNLRLLSIVLRRPLDGLPQPLVAVGAISIVAAGIAAAVTQLLSGMLGLVVAAAMSIGVTAVLLVRVDRRLNLGLGRILVDVFRVDTRILRTALHRRRRQPPR
jgi:O-antigen/teichoic acid export membrane protein